MRSRLIRLIPFFAAMLGGGVLATAFPPFHETANAWLALVPLLWITRTCAPRRAAACGFWCGLVFWLATLSWFPAIVKNGGPLALVLVGQLGLSAWCAGSWALFAALSACLWRNAGSGRRVALTVVGDPILWAGCEWLRANLLSGFAWNFLGVAQVGNAPLAQVASVAGVYGVSAALVGVNGALTGICQRMYLAVRRGDVPAGFPTGSKLMRSLESALPFVLVIVVLAWGGRRIAALRASEAETLRVALVQPCSPCVASGNAEGARAAWTRLLESTRTASAAHPELVVWPECALPGIFPIRPSTQEMIDRGVRAAGCDLLAGCMAADLADDGARRWYNAGVAFSTNGTQLGCYRKQHLVPFGEYIPLDKTFPVLQKLVPTGASCHAGTNSAVFALSTRPDVKLGPLICFEDTVPALSRQAVRDGATVLALMTNDAWFDHSCEAEQHFMQAVYRAIENGVPLVRAANSGISCIVSPDGEVRRLELEGALSDFDGFLVGACTPRRHPALYTMLGDAPLLVLFALVLVAACVFSRRPVSATIAP